MKLNDAYKFARDQRKNPTKAEDFFWQKVRGRKINGYKILRQYPIQYDEVAGFPKHFFPDFYCSKRKLIIEIDGGIHKTQIEYDKHREDILKSMGYSIIRFTNKEVLDNWSEVKGKLIEKLEALSKQ